MAGDRTSPEDGECRHEVERNVTLPYVPSSVTGARKLLQSDLTGIGLGDDRVDDASLVLSELVSNALRHAAPLPAPDEDTVGVAWRAGIDPASGSSGWVEISVRDGGSSSMPRVARPSVSGLGGRGLGIVQALAGRWGTEMDGDTTTVWAVLEITGDDLAHEGSGAEAASADPVPSDTPGDPAVVEVPVGARGNAAAGSALL
ncbi:ATP-binding protein [Nocardiopsis sp. HNM0947]|uniref:ATP-binding protein n=1 Tax=Nocardiopsis coralli TaxID=2772213 RepID=A0ABR9PDH6_9ACTN|nr:ATP-binding protein [Nocardiopsis coralli]MBE3001805.1 ATP-binding protein [Nocardiopsis coralli]